MTGPPPSATAGRAAPNAAVPPSSSFDDQDMGDIAGRPRFDENGLRIPFFRGPHLVNQADTPYEPPLPAPGDKPPSMWDDASAAASSIGSYMPFGIDSKPRGQGELSHFVLPPRVQTRRWYGRFEDGYLLWSSVYLHEWFGFKYYEPLSYAETPNRQGGHNATGVPPWLTDFYSLPNMAIPMSYFCVGIALQLIRTPLIVYFIHDLEATAAQVNVLFTVMAVPWCFKVLYGFLSDCVPIRGERRKPYLLIGWLGYLACNLILAAIGSPSVGVTVFFVFLMTSFYMLADVMTDALIVERGAYEKVRGTMQAKGYVIRFFGSTVAAMVGAVVYNVGDEQNVDAEGFVWRWGALPMWCIFLMNGLFVVPLMLPFIPYLVELSVDNEVKAFWAQCEDLFATVQLRAVWQPMTFIYFFNALQIANAAWMSFLVDGIDFAAWEIGALGTFASLATWFGIWAYQKWFFSTSWRMVFVICSIVNCIVGLLQLVLITRTNVKLGIPDLLFAMGDDGVQEFLIGIQFLPACIMYMGMCPEGAEGTTYAMLTTFSNLAGTIAFDLSTIATKIWDVTTPTLAAGEFQGVFNLSLLCTLAAPIPLVLIYLIPKDRKTQDVMLGESKKTWLCGVIFICVLIFTMLLTFAESIHEVREGNASVNEYEGGR
ncbi:hypothetical protein TeGR_g414 [Tetraparma gracilis]|uniref:Uncharacterized protein n=1 Tax=Tetraparma gracilis TaxID=2962635 RepID=A0ABQ6MCW0_9STRA|nr:hypothetical protein TeGR_g414 [Tetraparma gracilis]